MKQALFIAATLFILACGPVRAEQEALWPSAMPAIVGLDDVILEDHRKLCEDTGADSCLVIRQGKVVSEWYSPRYPKHGHTMMPPKNWTAS